MRFSRPLHNCRPVVPYARNRRPHIPPPGQVLVVSAAGCITCQYGKPTLNGESSIASRCIRSCLAAHGPEGERSTQTVVLTQSRDSCMLQLLPRIFNAVLYCFLCPPSKRIMPFVPHVRRPLYTMGSRPGTLRFFCYTFRASFQTCGRSRGILALVVVDASILGFVPHGALQPAYTTFNVSTQSPPCGCHRLPY
jgi:hypothetical protein